MQQLQLNVNITVFTKFFVCRHFKVGAAEPPSPVGVVVVPVKQKIQKESDGGFVISHAYDCSYAERCFNNFCRYARGERVQK